MCQWLAVCEMAKMATRLTARAIKQQKARTRVVYYSWALWGYIRVWPSESLWR
jgi:hypothetical protein